MHLYLYTEQNPCVYIFVKPKYVESNFHYLIILLQLISINLITLISKPWLQLSQETLLGCKAKMVLINCVITLNHNQITMMLFNIHVNIHDTFISHLYVVNQQLHLIHSKLQIPKFLLETWV